MKKITKEEYEKLKKMTKDCESHIWVRVQGLSNKYMICGNCGINKSWFDNK